MFLESEDKFSDSGVIDRFVCAEIPPADQNPRLHEIVTKCMMHGPCGTQNSLAPCMENGKCKKMFPKDFSPETRFNAEGYPLYRRRMGVSTEVRGKVMDNRYVVPYNPYLLLKYNAHINVEVCTSLRAVKYIYKYIYKGFDCANLVLLEGHGQHDEIRNYIDARYVSAPEAMWRLLEFPMHDCLHAVKRLPVHLPKRQYTATKTTIHNVLTSDTILAFIYFCLMKGHNTLFRHKSTEVIFSAFYGIFHKVLSHH